MQWDNNMWRRHRKVAPVKNKKIAGIVGGVCSALVAAVGYLFRDSFAQLAPLIDSFLHDALIRNLLYFTFVALLVIIAFILLAYLLTWIGKWLPYRLAQAVAAWLDFPQMVKELRGRRSKKISGGKDRQPVISQSSKKPPSP